MDVRSRFFAVFLRDKVKKCSRLDRKIIHEGNVAAHNGDPIVDATMFKRRHRTDTKTYIMLYGLDWLQVLEYSTYLVRL
jgi:hypothetical protein